MNYSGSWGLRCNEGRGKYLVGDSPNKAFENAYSELVKGGLKDLVDYATWVVDEFGKYSEDSLVGLGMKILRLSHH